MFASRFSSSIQSEPISQPQPEPQQEPSQEPEAEPATESVQEPAQEPEPKVQLKIARFEQYDNKGWVVGLVHEQTKRYFETLILFQVDFEAQDYLNKALEELKPNIDALKNSLKNNNNVVNIPTSITI